ncbi:phage antirepressor KilAC domain-containing protein [uncultured Clostridium sp.]|uniref:phage antirepressor n=1 Tax=uncultured Clostridium sp. TaxID=59620 RepID=UPI00262ED231|nr:phage antirepressor KilAC domain-containing protein [uncultured Clostridium sp.]
MSNINNTLEIIKQQNVLGRNFKVYGTPENPLFLAKDVAEWIDYSQIKPGVYKVSQMVEIVDKDEKLITTMQLPGDIQKRQHTFLTEDGLYEVLMQSRKPIAKAFKKEVKKILKEIRLTGGYIHTEADDDDDTVIAKALIMAQRKIELRNNQIKEQQKIIEEQAPKVEYFNKVLDSSKLITITEIANDLGISARKLNKFLETEGIQNKQYKQWKISQEFLYLIEENYADYEIYLRSFGRKNQQLKWTEKGRNFIVDLVRSKLLDNVAG